MDRLILLLYFLAMTSLILGPRVVRSVRRLKSNRIVVLNARQEDDSPHVRHHRKTSITTTGPNLFEPYRLLAI